MGTIGSDGVGVFPDQMSDDDWALSDLTENITRFPSNAPMTVAISSGVISLFTFYLWIRSPALKRHNSEVDVNDFSQRFCCIGGLGFDLRMTLPEFLHRLHPWTILIPSHLKPPNPRVDNRLEIFVVNRVTLFLTYWVMFICISMSTTCGVAEYPGRYRTVVRVTHDWKEFPITIVTTSTPLFILLGLCASVCRRKHLFMTLGAILSLIAVLGMIKDDTIFLAKHIDTFTMVFLVTYNVTLRAMFDAVLLSVIWICGASSAMTCDKTDKKEAK